MGEFGELIERERKKKWISRRKFYNFSGLSCSYPRYTVIEKGNKPYASLELAIELIEKLQIDESRGLHAFVRDQMPDAQKKSYFVDLNEDYYSSRISSIVIDDDEKREFFEASPIYKEMSVYISMFSNTRSITISEISKKFKIKKCDAQLILNQLETLGIIVRSKENSYVVPSGSWLSTPNSAEYRKAVSIVFSDAVNSHFSMPYYEGETYEHSTLRLVSKQMISELHLRIKNLARWFSVQPDPKDNVVPYRFFCGGNFASFGDNKTHFTPGKRSIKKHSFFDNYSL